MSDKPDPLAGYVKLSSVASYFGEHRDTTMRRAMAIGIPVFKIGGTRKLLKTHAELLKVHALQRPCAKGS